MKYPSFEEIEAATHYQLGQWYRFLPSPGLSGVYGWQEELQAAMKEETLKMDRIVDRHKELGGWNPTLSKAIGWNDARI